MKPRSIGLRGSVAGAIGATVLAVWFLVVDASQGVPFRTPALLASSLLGVEGFETRPGLIALYTVIHYAAFTVVGILAAWVLAKMETAPSLLLGLVLGFILFDIVFYASVYLTGIDVVAELGWVEVLSGNLLAGLAIMGYLHMIRVTRPVTWIEVLSQKQIVREGVVAGLVGAGAVAIWFLIIDVIQGRPFFTPAALGSALFLGAADLANVQVNFWTVTGYSLIHLTAFVVVGIIATIIVGEAEDRPPMILGVILLFVVFEALFMGLLAVVAEFLLGPLAWWSIAAGNLVAVGVMGWFFWHRHPKLKEAMGPQVFDRAG
jgi:hypothetical protein